MNNIVLLGMPGAGKSTLGVLLAKSLGLGFVDTDVLIQEKEGCLLQQIICHKGVQGFLDLEQEVLCSLKLSRHVVSTGGSAVYAERAMEKFQTDRCVYLHLSLDDMKKRLTDIHSRGVILRNGQGLDELWLERDPLYRRWAHLVVESRPGDVEKTLEDLLGQLQ